MHHLRCRRRSEENQKERWRAERDGAASLERKRRSSAVSKKKERKGALEEERRSGNEAKRGRKEDT